jgi:phosphoribosyl-AMP cyclohydrolase
MSSPHKELEEGTRLLLDFEKLKRVAACGQPVVPVVVQDIDSKEVLVVAYVNQIALDYALEHKVAAMWSTSRHELWIKGATSGEYLDLIETRINCEQNSLVYLVKIRGKGACHTKNQDGTPRKGCYYRKISADKSLVRLNQ